MWNVPLKDIQEKFESLSGGAKKSIFQFFPTPTEGCALPPYEMPYRFRLGYRYPMAIKVHLEL